MFENDIQRIFKLLHVRWMFGDSISNCIVTRRYHPFITVLIQNIWRNHPKHGSRYPFQHKTLNNYIQKYVSGCLIERCNIIESRNFYLIYSLKFFKNAQITRILQVHKLVEMQYQLNTKKKARKDTSAEIYYQRLIRTVWNTEQQRFGPAELNISPKTQSQIYPQGFKQPSKFFIVLISISLESGVSTNIT